MKICKGIVLASGGIAALLMSAHGINSLIFQRAKKDDTHNSIWRGEYGDIAFTKKGSGEPLLLLHGIGIGAGSHEWDDNIDELSKTFTVYCVDLPGFGSSSKEKITYNSYYYAVFINTFIRKIISKKTNVIALNLSGGYALAAATLRPSLFNKIMVINPYDKGLGEMYKESAFVKFMLPVPVVGSSVYNFISSKQSILAFLERNAPQKENYEEVRGLMEKQYISAHRLGINSKYAAISFINGLLETSLHSLMKNCPIKRLVLISGDSAMPFFSDDKGFCISEIEGGRFYPNIYKKTGFYRIITEFFTNKDICES